MGRIGEDPRLKAVLEKARSRPKLPSASDIPREMALALVESCRQGTAPVQGALALAVGREDLIDSIKHDLIHVASRGSCLRVINGVFGIGKTLTLRVLQEYAHREEFATSFLTLSSRECPMYDLSSIYRHIVRGIRVADCVDRPALEQILETWAKKVTEDALRQRVVPWALSELDAHFQGALTQYYEGVRFARSEKTDLALRWLRGETTVMDARHLGVNSNISPENALVMLGNLTRMLRFVGLKGLVTLLDEADAIPSLPSAVKREEAYANLFSLAHAASSTPYSYFVYATTPAFFDGIPPGFDEALKNVTNLEQLKSRELTELAQEIRDLHFQAYGWHRGDLRGSSLREFVRMCVSTPINTPRAFVRALIAALDICEQDKEFRLDRIGRMLG
ncbi:MAG: DUF2791 family P-loop domain-containing protein [Dehalococcoidia bacterium]|nr:DUF2791 family P-loop domain-containing protein [Dehalococcoidia bacterium]